MASTGPYGTNTMADSQVELGFRYLRSLQNYN